MKNKTLFMAVAIISIALNSLAQVTSSFTDSRDGKIYKTVTIGTQTWMAENLAYKVNNGCWAYNDDLTNVATYGYLYNWETAKTACPTGWHLPTEIEWTTLINYLGQVDSVGGKLKSNSIWVSHDGNVTNSSGFSALPGGFRFYVGHFYNIGLYGHWWSASEYDSYYAKSYDLGYDFSGVTIISFNKGDDFSVRCVKN